MVFGQFDHVIPSYTINYHKLPSIYQIPSMNLVWTSMNLCVFHFYISDHLRSSQCSFVVVPSGGHRDGDPYGSSYLIAVGQDWSNLSLAYPMAYPSLFCNYLIGIHCNTLMIYIYIYYIDDIGECIHHWWYWWYWWFWISSFMTHSPISSMSSFSGPIPSTVFTFCEVGHQGSV